MANTVKIKRSATPGKIPTTAALALGELAVNTNDGKLFLKKSVGGVESIVDVTAVSSVNGKTGDVSLTKADIGLGSAENTALSTWAGSSNITTLGTIGAGVWSGSTILVAKGGTGATSLSGLVKGNGSAAFSAAVAGTDYLAPGGALGTPISGNLANCTFPTLNQNTTGSAATLATPRTLTIGNTGKTFNGSANVAWTLAEIGGLYDGYGDCTLANHLIGANRIEVSNGLTGNRFAYIDFHGDDTYTDFGLRLLRGNTGSNTWSELTHRGTGALSITATDGGTIRINTSNLGRALFDAVGNVALGCTDVSTIATPGFKVYSGGGVVPQISNVITIGSGGVTSFIYYNTHATYNPGYRFYVQFNGGVYNYSANNVNLSDQSMKIEVEPAGDYLAKVCAVPIKTYRYVGQGDDADRTIGVIAQDVLPVMPELVDQDFFEFVDGDNRKLLGIYQTDVQYILWKALQELAEEVAALRQQLILAN